MSRFIATSAIRGAHGVVTKAEEMLKNALEKHGADTPVVFVDSEGVGSTYFLPVIYGYSGHKVEKLGDMTWPLEHARSMLPPVPGGNLWLPYLGETADAGVATLFAEEIINGLEFVNGKQQ